MLREIFDLNFLREHPLEILPTRSSPTIFRTFPWWFPSGRSRLLRLHLMYPWRGGKRKTTRMTMTAASLRGSLRQRAMQRRMDPRTIRKSSLKHHFSRVGISLVSPKIIFTSERTSEDSSVRALTKCSPCSYKTMFWGFNHRRCDWHHRTGDWKDFRFSAGIISDVSCIFFYMWI